MKKVIIIGGLGFLGKNLYARLIKEGYHVTILANRIAEHDEFVTADVRKNVLIGDILDKDFLLQNLVDYDFVFSFAGNSGASDSIKNPYKDLDTNLKGHLNILEACRQKSPRALLIFPSSRLVYGKPESNPVNENHPLKPESFYAVHKITTEQYYLMYQRLYNLRCLILRISNPFGPHQRFGSNHYGILNWFIHKATSQEEIVIYGDGSQRRDFIHVDDLVNLFILSMRKELNGKIFNVGYGKGISMKEAVDAIQEVVPEAKVSYQPWPEIDKKIETGDYISDIRALKEELGWEPVMNFKEGIRNTIKSYEGKQG